MRGEITEIDRIRFWQNVREGDAARCWPWMGHKRENGYGVFFAEHGIWTAHRLAYTLRVGPIPPPLTIDHLCRVKDCMNPSHLEAVTNSENTIRAVRKRLCTRGHPMEGENAATHDSDGHLVCRECKKISAAGWRSRRRCPKCERVGALGQNTGDRFASIRACRYCGYELVMPIAGGCDD